MADLTPAGRTESSDFTHRVLGKVVVEEKLTLHFAFLKIINELLVFFGAQRRGYQCLGFTTSKQRPNREREAANPLHR